MENLIKIEDTVSSNYILRSYPVWRAFDLRTNKPLFSIESDPYNKRSFNSRILIENPQNGKVDLYIKDSIYESDFEKFISESKTKKQELVFKLFGNGGEILAALMVSGAQSQIVKQFSNNDYYIYLTYDYACMKM